MDKIQNESSRYNVWQNSIYAISIAWERDKVALYIIFVQILLTVAIHVTSIFLPRTVVAQIINGMSLEALIITILVFTIVLTFLRSVCDYFDSGERLRKSSLRFSVSRDILTKVISSDYANLEEQRFIDSKRKAQESVAGNAAATEQIYYSFKLLGINVLGFVVYTILLTTIHPGIMFIVASTSIFGIITRRKANKWRFNNDNDEAAVIKRVRYITRVGNEYSLAKDIRLFPMIPWLKDIYNTNIKLAHDFTKKVQTKHLIADVMDCFAAFVREGIAYAYLIWQVLFHNMPVDSFVLMFAAIGGFSVWIAGILDEYGNLSENSLSYCRLREFLEYPNKFKYENGEDFAIEKDKPYVLELKNVTFRYSGARENTLENICLTIKEGEKLAIVGLNGAGKTTLVKLLCGFYDPTDGHILLNGKDIREYNRKQYYTLFAAVFQEFNILPLSIAENVSQQPLDKTDISKVKYCLRLSGLLEKVEGLVDNVKSRLGKDVNEDAIELSGGETQKLMLARALYKNAPVLILDEPTAALDPIAESNLYSQYNELSAGRTSIYISHRLASTHFCDRIVLIANKRIAEIGTHEELLKQKGIYTELFEVQSMYYREESVV